MVGIAKIQGVVGHVRDAAPAELDFPAVGSAGEQAVGLRSGGRLLARNHRDLARGGRAVPQHEGKHVTIGRLRDPERVQEFRAFEEDAEVPAAIVVRAARERAQALEELVDRATVERDDAGTHEILQASRGARDHERVGEPEVANRRAALGQPGAMLRVPAVVTVVGEGSNLCDAQQELRRRQHPGARLERSDEIERSLLSLVGEGAAFLNVPIAQRREVTAVIGHGRRRLLPAGCRGEQDRSGEDECECPC